MRIEIRIRNNLKYAYVALLVDRPDFLRDLKLSRKRLGIANIIDYNEYGRWFSHLKRQQKEPLPPPVSTQIGGRVFTHNPKAYAEYKKILKKTPLGRFRLEVIRLVEKYKLHYSFEGVVKKAITCAEIHDRDFMTTQLLSLSNDNINDFAPEGKSFLTTRRRFIEVTPYTTIKDISEHFDMAKEEIEWRSEFEKEFGSVFHILSPITKHASTKELRKTLSEIRRDRAWYWERQKKPPTLYREILDGWNASCPIDHEEYDENTKGCICIFEENVIEQAVNTYKRRLSTKI